MLLRISKYVFSVPDGSELRLHRLADRVLDLTKLWWLRRIGRYVKRQDTNAWSEWV